MLFSSYEFLFLFLPAALGVFFAAGRRSHRLAIAWMTSASLAFYAWWYPPFVAILLASAGFNYAAGALLAREGGDRRRHLLAVAVAGNLALLGIFKYAGFLAASLDSALGLHLPVPPLALPLGISFFTLTQIAFLIDTARGQARDYDPVHYLLFVTYFPHLIAGPILHHRELMPQLDRRDIAHFSARRLSLGLAIFAVGLFKKTVIADSLAPHVAPAFAMAAAGGWPSAAEAWGAVLAYTLQLYFDFSGYSDMAIGLGRIIGVRLPLNFHSPYKAGNIIEFWQRWHMTLSRFLRDYLYIPLGGNRRGTARSYANLMATMLIGGLWHGAGWGFVLWGGLHGLYLVVNHAWRALTSERRSASAVSKVAAGLVTFVAVVVAWVPFRADGLAATRHMLAGMAGLAGWAPGGPEVFVIGEALPGWRGTWSWIAALLPVIWLCPNTQEIFARYGTLAPPHRCADTLPIRALTLRWRLSSGWAYLTAIVAAVAVLYCSRAGEFIYFQF